MAGRAVTDAIYLAIVLILKEGGGRCVPRDIITALDWPLNLSRLFDYLKRLEDRNLLMRHNKGVPFKSFITLPGPSLDGEAAPAPIPRHRLLKLTLPDPWKEPGSDADRRDIAVRIGKIRQRSEQSLYPNPQSDDVIHPGALMSRNEMAAIYAGQRYENFRGKEFLDNRMPSRPSIRGLQSCAAGLCAEAREL